MKIIKYIILGLWLFSVFEIPAVAKEKNKNYDYWLNTEVKLLITPAERQQFKALTTDSQREKFIALFWAKRDPTPSTKENEFKEEWYKRLKYVEKNFNYGPTRGINSDMGRVYMIFGPPAQTKGGAGGRRDNPMGGSQMEAPPQIWVYQAMPALGLNEPFRVVFRQYQFGYDLDHQTPQNILRAMEIFPKVVFFNPDLKELPQYKFKLEENSYEGKLIKDFISTGSAPQQIPISWKPHFSQALNQSSYVTFLVKIDTKKIKLKKGEELTFFGRLQGEGETKEDFLKIVKTPKAQRNGISIYFGLPVKPMKYTLYLGIRNKDKTKYSLFKGVLEVPNFWNQQLTTSSLILSPGVVKANKAKGRPQGFDPYLFGQIRAIPRFESIFKASESLNVFFQIYNAQAIEGKVWLRIEYFIVAPEGTYKLNAQEIKQKIEKGRAISGGTEVPLSPLKPGHYVFKIKIIDMNANKIIEKKANFKII